jgi:inorganic triphosphatase YgiF
MIQGTGEGPQEIELKLQVPPEDLERLLRHPRVESLACGEPSTRTLRSVYFDRPDLRLARAGVALRVRRIGDRFIQTVKSRGAGTAGLFHRTEFECEIPTERPDLTRVADASLRKWLRGQLADAAPDPVVETRVRRTTRRLACEGAEFLFELDRGELQTQAGTAAICELELELVRGNPAALYDLALELQESVDLRPVTISKADLGFAQLTGERPVPRKAGLVPPPDGPSLEALWIAVLGAGIDHLVANGAPARDSIDPEGVHQLRVAARRLRAALSLFAPLLPKSEVAHLRGELRWLARELGDARDVDVFLDETLEPLLRRTSVGADLKRVAEEARLLREEARARVRHALDSPRFPRLVLTLGRWLVARGWRAGVSGQALERLDAPARKSARPLIERRHRKVVSRGARIEELDAQARHRLRIRVKKLRYAGDFLRVLFPESSDEARRDLRELARLQDILGRQNDAATTNRLLASILERLGAEVRGEDLHAAGFISGCAFEGRTRDEASLAERFAIFAGRIPFWDESESSVSTPEASR